MYCNLLDARMVKFVTHPWIVVTEPYTTFWLFGGFLHDQGANGVTASVADLYALALPSVYLLNSRAAGSRLRPRRRGGVRGT